MVTEMENMNWKKSEIGIAVDDWIWAQIDLMVS